MTSPIRFMGRFVYQSLKLLLRITFILTGGLLTGFFIFLKIADNSSDDEGSFSGLRSGEQDKWGGPITSETKFKDWMY